MLKFSYSNNSKDFIGYNKVYIDYNLKDSSIKIELSNSTYDPMENIVPVMYPIMKLLEELQIDIKDAYFKKVNGDNNE